MGKIRLTKAERVKEAPRGNKAIYVYGSKKRANKVFPTTTMGKK